MIGDRSTSLAWVAVLSVLTAQLASAAVDLATGTEAMMSDYSITGFASSTRGMEEYKSFVKTSSWVVFCGELTQSGRNWDITWAPNSNPKGNTNPVNDPTNTPHQDRGHFKDTSGDGKPALTLSIQGDTIVMNTMTRIYAWDAQLKKQLWNVSIADIPGMPNNVALREANRPAFYGGKVFFFVFQGVLVSVDLASGAAAIPDKMNLVNGKEVELLGTDIPQGDPASPKLDSNGNPYMWTFYTWDNVAGYLFADLKTEKLSTLNITLDRSFSNAGAVRGDNVAHVDTAGTVYAVNTKSKSLLWTSSVWSEGKHDYPNKPPVLRDITSVNGEISVFMADGTLKPPNKIVQIKGNTKVKWYNVTEFAGPLEGYDFPTNRWFCSGLSNDGQTYYLADGYGSLKKYSVQTGTLTSTSNEFVDNQANFGSGSFGTGASYVSWSRIYEVGGYIAFLGQGYRNTTLTAVPFTSMPSKSFRALFFVDPTTMKVVSNFVMAESGGLFKVELQPGQTSKFDLYWDFSLRTMKTSGIQLPSTTVTITADLGAPIASYPFYSSSTSRTYMGTGWSVLGIQNAVNPMVAQATGPIPDAATKSATAGAGWEQPPFCVGGYIIGRMDTGSAGRKLMVWDAATGDLKWNIDMTLTAMASTTNKCTGSSDRWSMESQPTIVGNKYVYWVDTDIRCVVRLDPALGVVVGTGTAQFGTNIMRSQLTVLPVSGSTDSTLLVTLDTNSYAVLQESTFATQAFSVTQIVATPTGKGMSAPLMCGSSDLYVSAANVLYKYTLPSTLLWTTATSTVIDTTYTSSKGAANRDAFTKPFLLGSSGYVGIVDLKCNVHIFSTTSGTLLESWSPGSGFDEPNANPFTVHKYVSDRTPVVVKSGATYYLVVAAGQTHVWAINPSVTSGTKITYGWGIFDNPCGDDTDSVDVAGGILLRWCNEGQIVAYDLKDGTILAQGPGGDKGTVDYSDLANIKALTVYKEYFYSTGFGALSPTLASTAKVLDSCGNEMVSTVQGRGGSCVAAGQTPSPPGTPTPATPSPATPPPLATPTPATPTPATPTPATPTPGSPPTPAPATPAPATPTPGTPTPPTPAPAVPPTPMPPTPAPGTPDPAVPPTPAPTPAGSSTTTAAGSQVPTTATAPGSASSNSGGGNFGNAAFNDAAGALGATILGIIIGAIVLVLCCIAICIFCCVRAAKDRNDLSQEVGMNQVMLPMTAATPHDFSMSPLSAIPQMQAAPGSGPNPDIL